MENNVIVKLLNVTKKFGDTTVIKDFSLDKTSQIINEFKQF